MSAPNRPAVERRRYRRLELCVPLVFTLRTKAGTTVSRSGFTCNVCPGGVYFRTLAAKDLVPQQELTINLLVPRRGSQPQSTISLSGEAKVLRAERLPPSPEASPDNGEWWGVAAQFVCRPRVDIAGVESLFGTT